MQTDFNFHYNAFFFSLTEKYLWNKFCFHFLQCISFVGRKKNLIQVSCFLYYITLVLTKKFALWSEQVKTWKKSHHLVFIITQVWDGYNTEILLKSNSKRKKTFTAITSQWWCMVFEHKLTRITLTFSLLTVVFPKSL